MASRTLTLIFSQKVCKSTKRRFWKSFIAGLILSFVALSVIVLPITIGPTKASSATIYVPDSYPTIQAAVDAANVGDTIIVHPGTYTENVTVWKDHLTIKSESGPEVTTIDGSLGEDWVTIFCNTNSTVSGFTIKIGRGAGIYSALSSPVIRNNIIIGSGSHGIECSDSSIIITGNIIKGNDQIYTGITCYGGSPTVTNNVITGCNEGIWLQDDCSASVINNTVVSGSWDPHLVKDGIGIAGSSPTIKNNIVVGDGKNTRGLRSLAYAGNPSSPSISYNDVWGAELNYDGCSPGTGDISADPLFVNPANNNYHLQPGSPCIDAGDPSILDPDGSRSDMGAYGGSLEPTPEDNPPTVEIINPPHGETISGTVGFQTYATDDHGLEKVEFYIDDELKVTHGPFGPDTVASTCNWDCDTTPGSIHYIPNGSHTFKAKAYDTADQTSTETISFIVHNVIPAPEPDLDIMEPLEFPKDISPPFLPNALKIKAEIINKGTTTAEQPIVTFFLNDEEIGTVSLDSIGQGEQASASIEWLLNSNIENGTLEVRVGLIGQEDANPVDNVTTKVFSFYFVDSRYEPRGFRHDRDAYSFPNWGYRTWQREYWEDLWNFLITKGFESDFATILTTPLLSATFNLFGAAHCYGMATSSSIYYVWPDLKPVDKPTFAMSQVEAKPDIIERQWEQIIHVYPIVWGIYKEEVTYNAASEYERTLNCIKDKNEPILLHLIKPFKCHSVVAYKILEISDDEKRVYIYENNRPYDDPTDDFYLAPEKAKDRDYYATFRPISNKASYTLGTTTWDRICAFTIWQTIPLEEIRDHLQFVLSSWLKELQEKALMLLRIRSPVAPLLTDQNGRRIGYVNGIFINEIPGAAMEQQLDSELFYLPSDLTYLVGTTGIEKGTLGLDFIVPTAESRIRVVIWEDIPVDVGSRATTTLSAVDIRYQVVTDTGEIIKPESVGELDTSDLTLYIPATIDIDPDTLNLKSKGQWITCYIELPEGYDVNNIDIETILLMQNEGVITLVAESSPTEVGDYDKNGIPDLMVKFNRATLITYLKEQNLTSGQVTLKVIGQVSNKIFEGTDTITITGGAAQSMAQPKFGLSQNYPNPCNPETTIEYSLAESCHVTLKIYNISGQLVKTLINEYQQAGYYKIMWHGDNDAGQEIASAVYFYRLKAGDKAAIKKMVVLK